MRTRLACAIVAAWVGFQASVYTLAFTRVHIAGGGYPGQVATVTVDRVGSCELDHLDSGVQGGCWPVGH